tara:strand:+ start:4548 stop:5177 length:630 start_codon:yes stop_codon:yes gene_type:complete
MESEPSAKNTIQFIDFLKSKLKLFISLSVIFIFVGAFFLWLDYDKKNQRTKNSEYFIEAKILLTENNRSKSLEILENIIKTKDKTYSSLALFLILDQNLQKDKGKILKYFNEVLSVTDLDSEDLNLLRLKKAIFVSNTSNEQDMLDLLNPIINSESVWKNQSLKFIGDYYFSLKQFKKAEQYYLTLINSQDNEIDLKEIERKIKSIQNG